MTKKNGSVEGLEKLEQEWKNKGWITWKSGLKYVYLQQQHPILHVR